MLKQITACICLITLIVGCSTNPNSKIAPATLVTTTFSLDGLKITYDLSGNLDSIEVFGQSPASKPGYKLIAEADAKAKLVKFLHGENINSQEYIVTITRDISKAIGSGEDATRYARQINLTLIQSITNLTSQGHLVGLRKIDEQFVSNGTVYVAVYKWSTVPSSTPDTVMPKRLKPVITL